MVQKVQCGPEIKLSGKPREICHSDERCWKQYNIRMRVMKYCSDTLLRVAQEIQVCRPICTSILLLLFGPPLIYYVGVMSNKNILGRYGCIDVESPFPCYRPHNQLLHPFFPREAPQLVSSIHKVYNDPGETPHRPRDVSAATFFPP